MRRSQFCRASLVLTLVLLATPAMLHADPFEQRLISLPWPDSRDVAAADFNNDGLPDVAALNSYGPHFFECYPPPGPISCGGDRMLLTVALNEGMGHFAPVRTTPSMCAPWTIVAGDFNADGRQDVMIGNRGARDAFGVCWQASISYYPGNGSGGFFTDQHIAVPDEPVDMVAGDFDSDGILEVAVAFSTPGKVQLFEVTQNGFFISGPQWYAPAPLAAISGGDLDGDFDDEVVVGLESTAQVAILDLDAGGWQVETCTLAGTAPPPRALLVDDFTSDLRPDIAVGRPGGTSSIVTLLQRGPTGSYCATGTTLTTNIDGAYGGRLAAADLNADGIPDLATTDGRAHLLSLIGDGAGHFNASSPIATPGWTDAVVSADFNGDWIDDLVVGGPPLFQSLGAAIVFINDAPISNLMGLVMSGDDIDWNGVFDASSYDIVVGDLGTLSASGGDFTLATLACWADSWEWTNVPLGADPQVGRGWFIVGRPDLAGGPGTYDEWGTSQVGLRDAEINASAESCP